MSATRRRGASTPNNDPGKSGMAASPYRLRETSKLPSRYRDDDVAATPPKSRSPKKAVESPKKQVKEEVASQSDGGADSLPSKKARLSPPPSTSSSASASASPSKSLQRLRNHSLKPASGSSSPAKTDEKSPQKGQRRGRDEMLLSSSLLDLDEFDDEEPTSSQMISGPTQPMMPPIASPYPSRPARRALITSPTRSSPSTVAVAMPTISQAEADSDWQEMESLFDLEMFDSEEARKLMLRRLARYKYQTELGRMMRSNVKRLKNLLRLPKARQWVVSEFFYSGIDEQLFLGENEFAQIIRESFPNLKTLQLNKTEWRTIRRLLGKPRRCSQLFFDEERESLECKRQKIRGIYEGSYLRDALADFSDLPQKLPKPLVVGMRVYARVRTPKDGIYAGNIDALVRGGYRIIFEKRDLPPIEVPDTEVIVDGRLELLSIAYFVEQANSKLPQGIRPLISAVRNADRPHVVRGELNSNLNYTMSTTARKAILNGTAVNSGVCSERVGNFPLRFLVILVKLTKLTDVKKRLCRTMAELNSEAEKMNLITSVYPEEFQDKYALVVLELDAVNRQIEGYLQTIQEYSAHYTPSNGEVIHQRPETVRRLCASQAQQIVHHCNQGLNVTHNGAIRLVTSLTSLLLQMRALGQQKLSALDLKALNDSMNEIRTKISPRNAGWFQDNVEVYMKQIHNIMIQSGIVSAR